MPATPTKIVMVGLGAVAQSHLRALEATQGATVIAGIDPHPPEKPPTFAGQPFPVYPDPHTAQRHHNPDLVVIATPTATHAAVCQQVAECFPDAELLVEKPAADNYPDARRILCDLAAEQPVHVAYHMAYAPEVTWGHHITQSKAADLGDITAITAYFCDPYATDLETAKARFTSSWLDSGINALSVIDRFATPIERTSLRPIDEPTRTTYEARLTCRAGNTEIPATILTSWYVTAPTRTTQIKYTTGATLTLDHHAVAGHLTKHGQVLELFGTDGQVPRRETHYRALYHHYLTQQLPLMETHQSLHLHNLLMNQINGQGDG